MSDTAPTQDASAWEWLRAGLVSADFVWTTLCLGGYAPESRMATSVLTAAALAALLLDPARPRIHPASWLPVPFLAYGAANVAWVSPVPWLGWADWTNWAQMAAVFCVVLSGVRSRPCRHLLAGTLVALGVVCGVLALYQHFLRPHWIMTGRTQADQYLGRSSGSFGIPNSLGVFSALLIPPVAFVALSRARSWAQRAASGAALAMIALGFVLAVSRGAWLALAAALVLRALLAPGRAWAKRLGGAALVLAAVGIAGGALYAAWPVMRLRVDQLVANAGESSRPVMWRGAWAIFREHPVLGSGAGSYDLAFEPHRPEGFQMDPVYCHCDYLNTLSDYGATGFILAFGAALWIGVRCAGSRGLPGAAFAGLLAFALHLLVDFHLKVPALAMAVAALAALVTQASWASPRGAVSPPRIAAAALAVLVLALEFAWILPMQRAESLRREARVVVDLQAKAGQSSVGKGELLESLRARLAKAVVLDPRNAQAWSDLAYIESLLAIAHPDRTLALGADVQRDASRALKLCPAVWEFWVRLGTGLDMQFKWQEGGECFTKALALAPNRADAWYYSGYHLSLRPDMAELAAAAEDECLRLDPGFLLAQFLRQRLEIQLNPSR